MGGEGGGVGRPGGMKGAWQKEAKGLGREKP